MTNQFLVEISLPTYLSKELVAYIPDQTEVVNKLFQQGFITCYSLALDNSKIWIIFNCASKHEVIELIEEFPIAPYINYKINTLAFSEQLDYAITTMSLN